MENLTTHSHEIPPVAQDEAKRFSLHLAVFYGATFGLTGTYLPFFPVWLKAIGIEPAWIGLILAAPSVTRFTILPMITAMAERRRAVRGGIILTAFITAISFAILGLLTHPVMVFAFFAMMACFWTPIVPLLDAYALKGIARYKLDYGPLRLWGSAAFVVGALVCGLLVDVLAPRHLIWVIVLVAAIGAMASLSLRPIDADGGAHKATAHSARWLLRRRGFLSIIAASALIQSSHAGYYAVASIEWQTAGVNGMALAMLWSLGVLAEIVVFWFSPRFTLPTSWLVIIGGAGAALRWAVTTQALPMPVVALIQLLHGVSFGCTMLGTMGLLMRYVPSNVMARAQGYMSACSGIIMSTSTIAAGAIYARYGANVYYVMMVLALVGMLIMLSGRRYADVSQPATP